MIHSHKQTTPVSGVQSSDVITFTVTLILPADVDSVKTITVEADAQKLKSGSQRAWKCGHGPKQAGNLRPLPR